MTADPLRPRARMIIKGRHMRCSKHGCVMTETITDEVFCGVCRQWELTQKLEAAEALADKAAEEMRKFLDHADRTHVYAGSYYISEASIEGLRRALPIKDQT